MPTPAQPAQPAPNTMSPLRIFDAVAGPIFVFCAIKIAKDTGQWPWVLMVLIIGNYIYHWRIKP